ncbi:hypothetical protein [Corallococcus carmarthensis]|uniref:hypothetical protein n=1 Tax=Corallococcus carmarthensis TaxID=2316728 RepID=UPI00148DE712|nr:hypothetical protein [Corallococcus carmarthensis]
MAGVTATGAEAFSTGGPTGVLASAAAPGAEAPTDGRSGAEVRCGAGPAATGTEGAAPPFAVGRAMAGIDCW